MKADVVTILLQPLNRLSHQLKNITSWQKCETGVGCNFFPTENYDYLEAETKLIIFLNKSLLLLVVIGIG